MFLVMLIHVQGIVAMEAEYSLNLLAIIRLSKMSIPSTINCGHTDFFLFPQS